MLILNLNSNKREQLLLSLLLQIEELQCVSIDKDLKIIFWPEHDVIIVINADLEDVSKTTIMGIDAKGRSTMIIVSSIQIVNEVSIVTQRLQTLVLKQ